MSRSTAPPPITVPLLPSIHDLARQFAVEQADAVKGKQTYLNTLAVWAVHRYLSWLQIETSLDQSNSWNAGLRALLGTADLVLPHLGRLECCPVLPGEMAIALPPVSNADPIGYVAVQLGDRLSEAQLLGFLPAHAVPDTAETIAIATLQPLDHLFDCLSELEKATTAPQIALPATLSCWLQNQFEEGWQAVEALLGAAPVWAVRRAAVQRAKAIALPQQDHSLALIVTLAGANSEQVEIHLQVCPLEPLAVLPADLTLRILTETGEVFREVSAEAADTFVQYEFTGQPGEPFSVELVVGDVRLLESFVI